MRLPWWITVRNSGFAILWLMSSLASAQNTTFFLGFTDKECSQNMTDTPELFLSARALDRRDQQNIPIDEFDLPACQKYVDSVRNVEGVTLLGVSRWLNGVLIEANDSLFDTLTTWSFIGNWTSVAKVADGEGAADPTEETAAVAKVEVIEDVFLQHEVVGAWDMKVAGFRGEDIWIAVMDDGFRGVDELPHFAHLFDNDQLIDSYDYVLDQEDVFNLYSHGTRVLSVMAAQAYEGFEGLVPEASYALYNTESGTYERRTEEYWWLFAAERADSVGIDVINTSLGYNEFDKDAFDYATSDLDGQTAVISRASEIAASRGMLLVTSAGNEGNNAWATLTVPGDAAHTLSVGGVNALGEHQSFSSIGPTADGRLKPDVSALATNVVTLSSSGNQTPVSGTSFAAPLVTSLAVGAWQAFPDLTAEELFLLIQLSGDQQEEPNNQVGYGVPNFSRLVENYISLRGTGVSLSNVFPQPYAGGPLYLSTAGIDASSSFSIAFFDAHGAQIFFEEFESADLVELLPFDFQDLSAGMYFYHIFQDGEVLGADQFYIP